MKKIYFVFVLICAIFFTNKAQAQTQWTQFNFVTGYEPPMYFITNAFSGNLPIEIVRDVDFITHTCIPITRYTEKVKCQMYITLNGVTVEYALEEGYIIGSDIPMFAGEECLIEHRIYFSPVLPRTGITITMLFSDQDNERIAGLEFSVILI